MSDQHEAPTTLDQFAAQLEQADDNAEPETEAQNEGEQEAGESEVETTDEAVESEGEQPGEPESLDDKVVKWSTASGDEFEVPVAELKQGYMRHQDYTQKQQNFAVEREQAVKQVNEQFQTVQTFAQEYGQLHSIEQQIAAYEQAIPTMDKYSDPVSYFDAVTTLQTLKENRNGLANHVQSLIGQSKAQQEQDHATKKQGVIAAVKALPGFSNELVQQLNTTAGVHGYTQDDLTAMTDPRFVGLLHDAMQFRALQAKRPEAMQKVKGAPVKQTRQAAIAPDSTIQKQIRQFAGKKDMKSFAALYENTLT